MDPARREVIEKAWDDAEKAESAPEEKPVIEAVAEEVKEPVAEAPAAEPTEKVDTPYDVEKKAATAREQPATPAAAAPVTDKAPASWKPALREQWAKLPPDVRSEVNRREREIQEGFKQTESVRKFANDFAQIVQPYSHMIAASGSTPLRAVASLMQTAGQLTSGDQEQKARVVANIIGQYGVDPAVLDKVLSGLVKDGRVSVQNPQPEQPPAWARPMFEFMSTVQQRQVMAQEKAKQEAAEAIEQMAEKPFFEDLREEMADVMEVAARRGMTLTLEQAYDRAVKLNPEISGILAQRAAAAKVRSPVSEAAATLARARKASSTVASAPAGDGARAVNAPRSRREAIEAAWENAGG